MQRIESQHTVVEVFATFRVLQKAADAQPAAVILVRGHDGVDQLHANHTGKWMIAPISVRKHGRTFYVSINI